MSSGGGLDVRRGQLLRLAPVVVIVGVLSLAALSAGLLASVGIQAGVSGRPSLDAYRAVLGHPGFPASYGFSVLVASVGTAVAVAGALLVGFRWSRPSGRMRAAKLGLLQLNLSVPHLVWAVALLATFSASGWVARLATFVGVIDRPAQFPALVNDRWGLGIIAHIASKELPFIVLTLLPLSGRSTRAQLDQATLLGASAMDRFRHVYLPAVAPAVVPAGLAVFAFSLGAFEPAAVLGVENPRSLAVVALDRFRDPDLAARAEAFAISTVLLATCLVVAALVWLLTRRWLVRPAGPS
ncbi:MAG: ABC transporter permease subunit [Acidimicrobiales bacterium]